MPLLVAGLAACLVEGFFTSTFNSPTSSLQLEAMLVPLELLMLLLLPLLQLLWLRRRLLRRPLRTGPSSTDSNLSRARGFGRGYGLMWAPLPAPPSPACGLSSKPLPLVAPTGHGVCRG